MGFYLRKSLRAGPFRFNLSKSGLGVSAGIPGFRVGAGPRGNYVHVGAHGVYYRATLGGKPGTRSAGHPPETQLWLPSAGSDILLEDTTGATPAQLLPTGADDLVKQLNDAGQTHSALAIRATGHDRSHRRLGFARRSRRANAWAGIDGMARTSRPGSPVGRRLL